VRTACPNRVRLERPLTSSHHLEPCIVGFTIVNAAGNNRAFVRLPRFIAKNGFARAILVFDLELREQRDLTAVNVVLPAAKAQPSAIPTITKQGSDGVLTHVQHLGHVKGLITQAAAVTGPTRGQHMIANDLAIQVRFVHTQGTDVQTGLFDRFVQLEFTAQVRARLEFADIFCPGVTDKMRLPIRDVQQSCLSLECFAPI
jgi:hypothetical protein